MQALTRRLLAPALTALTKAQSALQAAEADKAGHRDKAIGLTKEAIDEVNLGIAAGNEKPKM
jgi:hypothetical protein